MSIELLLLVWLYAVGAFQFGLSARVYDEELMRDTKAPWYMTAAWFIVLPVMLWLDLVDRDNYNADE